MSHRAPMYKFTQELNDQYAQMDENKVMEQVKHLCDPARGKGRYLRKSNLWRKIRQGTAGTLIRRHEPEKFKAMYNEYKRVKEEKYDSSNRSNSNTGNTGSNRRTADMGPARS